MQDNNLKFWKYATLIVSILFVATLFSKPKLVEKIVYKEKVVEQQKEKDLETVKVYDKNGTLRKETVKTKERELKKETDISLEKQVFKQSSNNFLSLRYGATTDKETKASLFYQRKIMGTDNLFLSGDIGINKVDNLNKTYYSGETGILLTYKW